VERKMTVVFGFFLSLFKRTYKRLLDHHTFRSSVFDGGMNEAE
jgi:hypothetical protein